MSLATTRSATTDSDGGRRSLPRLPIILLAIAATLLVMSVVRILTGTTDLSSSGTLRAALVASIPIGLAGLGGLWAERAGVVNIGLEGMMTLGTFGAGYYGYFLGPWEGVLGAIGFGILGGLLHAIATVIFGVDHIVSGVAINIIALGVVQYLAVLTFTGVPGGGATRSPKIEELPTFTIGPLSDRLGQVEDTDWFFVSELAALLRVLVLNLSVLTVISLLLFALSWWILWRTKFGLRLRSVGEAPVAAESLGVNVMRYKFIAVAVSGALAGLAGGFLTLVATNVFAEGQTGGRGYIGLAAMIFGNWRPSGLLLGAGLFGYSDTLRLRGGGESVHGFLLVVAIALVALALWQWRRHSSTSALVAAVLGVFVAGWYLMTDSVPEDLTGLTPYVTTLLVLTLFAQRLRMPAADGLPYRRGSAG